jgi:hypothetical protein
MAIDFFFNLGIDNTRNVVFKCKLVSKRYKTSLYKRLHVGNPCVGDDTERVHLAWSTLVLFCARSLTNTWTLTPFWCIWLWDRGSAHEAHKRAGVAFFRNVGTGSLSGVQLQLSPGNFVPFVP